MQVREFMTKDVVCCTPETGLQRVAQMMIEHDCGAIPVVDNSKTKRVQGILTDRDIVCRAVAKGRNPLDLTAKDCMSSPVECIRQDASLEECCQMLEKDLVRRIPVVDTEGSCCGIVSQADIAQRASAEQVGEFVSVVSHHTEEPSAFH